MSTPGIVTPENGDALRERRHAAFNGVLTVSIALDGRGRIASGPDVRRLGLPGDEDYPLAEAMDDLAAEAGRVMNKLSAEDRDDDRAVESRPLAGGQEGRLPHLETPPGGGDDGAAGL